MANSIVHVDSRPSVHAHVEALKSRMREMYWVLRHLRRAGFTEGELARVYCTVVRPVLDYCAVVYHPMLTYEQDQAVERLQAQALKCIYGYKDSYATMREKAGITTHRARRMQQIRSKKKPSPKLNLPPRPPPPTPTQNRPPQQSVLTKNSKLKLVKPN